MVLRLTVEEARRRGLLDHGRRNKHGAQANVVGKIWFASRLEARLYKKLDLERKPDPNKMFFLRQVPFHLPGNVTWRCDFLRFDVVDLAQSIWRVTVIDAKGRRLPAFIRNKKQVEDLYPIMITEVTRA